MKVIFLQNVPNVARAGEIKDVASGYGRNYLIPKQMAMLANSPAINMVELQRKIAIRQQQEAGEEIAELARQMVGREVFLQAKAGASDKMYGSITNADIAAELESATGVLIDKKKIELDKPINQLGSHEVTIRLAKDITPKIKVTVTREQEEESKPEVKAEAEQEAEVETEVETEAEAVPELEVETDTEVEPEIEAEKETE